MTNEERDLSQLLWCDLQTTEERIRFIKTGRAYETGIIAPTMQSEFVEALLALKREEERDGGSTR